MQRTKIDAVSISEYLDNFKKIVQKRQKKISQVLDKLSEELPVLQVRRGRTEAQQRADASEVCDIILAQANDRFAFHGHLIASELVAPGKFRMFDKKFPVEQWTTAVQSRFLTVAKCLVRWLFITLPPFINLHPSRSASETSNGYEAFPYCGGSQARNVFYYYTPLY